MGLSFNCHHLQEPVSILYAQNQLSFTEPISISLLMFEEDNTHFPLLQPDWRVPTAREY